jgi:hypothetical protein
MAVPPAVLPSAPPPLAPPPVPAPVRIDDVKVVDDEPRRRRLYDDDDDDDEPRSRRRRDDDYDVRRPAYSKWDKVRIGFLIAFIGLCVVAGAYAIELMGRLIELISYMSGAVGGFNIARVFTRIGLILGFVATIAAIVGPVFWLFVSNRTGAMGFAITTLAVCGVYLLFQMVGRLVSAFNPLGVPRVVMMLTDLLGAAYFMMMGFYIRALAQQLDRSYVRNRGMLLVVLSSIMAGYELISGIIAMSVIGVGGILVLLWILFWLGAIIKIVVLVFAILAVYEGKRMVDRETG